MGIDIDESLLARARQLGTPANVEFRVQDILALNGEERFDVVWMHHVLEHIEDVPAVLSALARVSSRLLIEVPDIEQSWTQFLLRDLVETTLVMPLMSGSMTGVCCGNISMAPAGRSNRYVKYRECCRW